jgi:hypothetical protein
MPLYTFIHNLLNVLVQIANTIGLKKRFQAITGVVVKIFKVTSKSIDVYLPSTLKLISYSVYSSTLKMEVICFSEKSLSFLQTTQRCFPEDSIRQEILCMNLHRDVGYTDPDISRFPPIPPGECRECISTRSRELHLNLPQFINYPSDISSPELKAKH